MEAEAEAEQLRRQRGVRGWESERVAAVAREKRGQADERMIEQSRVATAAAPQTIRAQMSREGRGAGRTLACACECLADASSARTRVWERSRPRARRLSENRGAPHWSTRERSTRILQFGSGIAKDDALMCDRVLQRTRPDTPRAQYETAGIGWALAVSSDVGRGGEEWGGERGSAHKWDTRHLTSSGLRHRGRRTNGQREGRRETRFGLLPHSLLNLFVSQCHLFARVVLRDLFAWVQ